VTRFLFALITDARTVTCLFRVTNDCLDASLISFSGIVICYENFPKANLAFWDHSVAHRELSL
jgi:hypothetical protein